MNKDIIRENFKHFIDILNALACMVELFQYYDRHQMTEKKDIIRHICIGLVELEKEAILSFDEQVKADLPQLFEDAEIKELLMDFKDAKLRVRTLIDILRDYEILRADTLIVE
jgi:hypothetical protein